MKNIIYILLILLTVTSCKIGRFAYYNFANITDHKIFPKRAVENDSTAIFYFKEDVEKKLDITLTDGSSFEEFLEKNKTVAFLVIQNDSIKYEKYL